MSTSKATFTVLTPSPTLKISLVPFSLLVVLTINMLLTLSSNPHAGVHLGAEYKGKVYSFLAVLCLSEDWSCKLMRWGSLREQEGELGKVLGLGTTKPSGLLKYSFIPLY